MSAPTGAPSCLTLSQATMRRCAVAAVSIAVVHVPVLIASLILSRCMLVCFHQPRCGLLRCALTVPSTDCLCISGRFEFYHCVRHSAEQAEAQRNVNLGPGGDRRWRMTWRAWRCRPRWRMVAIKKSAGCLFPAPDRVAQVEAEKNAMLGPRRRREVTYNEARLAKQTALEASGLTPVKEGADEDFAPTAMAEESSDNSGSEVEDGVDNVAGSRKVCSTSMPGQSGRSTEA